MTRPPRARRKQRPVDGIRESLLQAFDLSDLVGGERLVNLTLWARARADSSRFSAMSAPVAELEPSARFTLDFPTPGRGLAAASNHDYRSTPSVAVTASAVAWLLTAALALAALPLARRPRQGR